MVLLVLSNVQCVYKYKANYEAASVSLPRRYTINKRSWRITVVNIDKKYVIGTHQYKEEERLSLMSPMCQTSSEKSPQLG